MRILVFTLMSVLLAQMTSICFSKVSGSLPPEDTSQYIVRFCFDPQDSDSSQQKFNRLVEGITSRNPELAPSDLHRSLIKVFDFGQGAHLQAVVMVLDEEPLRQSVVESPIVCSVAENGRVAPMNGNDDIPWGLDRIDQRNLPLDHHYSHVEGSGEGIDVYILDTGVDIHHPQFEGRASTGFEVYPIEGKLDVWGHGTHVAGIVAAADFGIATKANIISVRITGSYIPAEEFGGLEDKLYIHEDLIVAGLEYVYQRMTSTGRSNQTVVNLAFAAEDPHPMSLIDTALSDLSAAGAFVSKAAGNKNDYACLYGGLQALISPIAVVGASTIQDAKYDDSNYGNCVSLFAPGVDIISTWINGEIETESGTSMAAAHVAGVAAVYRAKYPEASAETILNAMKMAGTGIDIAGTDHRTPNISLQSSLPAPDEVECVDCDTAPVFRPDRPFETTVVPENASAQYFPDEEGFTVSVEDYGLFVSAVRPSTDSHLKTGMYLERYVEGLGWNVVESSDSSIGNEGIMKLFSGDDVETVLRIRVGKTMQSYTVYYQLLKYQTKYVTIDNTSEICIIEGDDPNCGPDDVLCDIPMGYEGQTCLRFQGISRIMQLSVQFDMNNPRAQGRNTVFYCDSVNCTLQRQSDLQSTSFTHAGLIYWLLPDYTYLVCAAASQASVSFQLLCDFPDTYEYFPEVVQDGYVADTRSLNHFSLLQSKKACAVFQYKETDTFAVHVHADTLLPYKNLTGLQLYACGSLPCSAENPATNTIGSPVSNNVDKGDHVVSFDASDVVPDSHYYAVCEYITSGDLLAPNRKMEIMISRISGKEDVYFQDVEVLSDLSTETNCFEASELCIFYISGIGTRRCWNFEGLLPSGVNYKLVSLADTALHDLDLNLYDCGSQSCSTHNRGMIVETLKVYSEDIVPTRVLAPKLEDIGKRGRWALCVVSSTSNTFSEILVNMRYTSIQHTQSSLQLVMESPLSSGNPVSFSARVGSDFQGETTFHLRLFSIVEDGFVLMREQISDHVFESAALIGAADGRHSLRVPISSIGPNRTVRATAEACIVGHACFAVTKLLDVEEIVATHRAFPETSVIRGNQVARFDIHVDGNATPTWALCKLSHDPFMPEPGNNTECLETRVYPGEPGRRARFSALAFAYDRGFYGLRAISDSGDDPFRTPHFFRVLGPASSDNATIDCSVPTMSIQWAKPSRPPVRLLSDSQYELHADVPESELERYCNDTTFPVWRVYYDGYPENAMNYSGYHLLLNTGSYPEGEEDVWVVLEFSVWARTDRVVLHKKYMRLDPYPSGVIEVFRTSDDGIPQKVEGHLYPSEQLRVVCRESSYSPHEYSKITVVGYLSLNNDSSRLMDVSHGAVPPQWFDVQINPWSRHIELKCSPRDKYGAPLVPIYASFDVYSAP